MVDKRTEARTYGGSAAALLFGLTAQAQIGGRGAAEPEMVHFFKQPKFRLRVWDLSMKVWGMFWDFRSHFGSLLASLPEQMQMTNPES